MIGATALRAVAAATAIWWSPAVLPVTLIAGTGIADITMFHGCIGVVLSNVFPWTERYVCEPIARTGNK